MAGVARIHYEIPEDLHREVKSVAALQGVTLKAFVIAALQSAVDAHHEEPHPKARAPRKRRDRTER